MERLGAERAGEVEAGRRAGVAEERARGRAAMEEMEERARRGETSRVLVCMKGREGSTRKLDSHPTPHTFHPTFTHLPPTLTIH